MQAIVTVFKTEFMDCATLVEHFTARGYEFEEFEFYYTCTIPSGQLQPFLSLLNKNDLPFGLQFENPALASV